MKNLQMFGIREKESKLMKEVNCESWSTTYSAGTEYEMADFGQGVGEFRCSELAPVLYSVLKGGTSHLESPKMTASESKTVEVVTYNVGTDVREFRVIEINESFKSAVMPHDSYAEFCQAANENIHLLNL
ncbi:hypothetical protein DC914_RS23210 [Vibrio parahaemolyticus]|uniref:hypothetical protein n=1 Tax=Vibrio parahaemolyticus TaxID=670 RepID=UPI0006C222C1|nr:hypothetical protein [Vibrio parahaemolyticus]EGR3229003.1 hypothetical protein [Vibrio parahaemolyticus]EGR5926752.1 hypothetical protein [Vibrio parahaemolyticus]EJG0180943.1 hypothetical protein [Vibrio parahaemolyticus]KOY32224.1 hypothetical protein ACX10_26290 [Vibrio parahaemolyticus]MCS0117369.1 hypothetical protein [Vibrio parahaemolyticus]